MNVCAKRLWGYAEDETLSNEQLISRTTGESDQRLAILLADHTEKQTIFRLLDVERAIGVKLTESCAMWPAASVSGLYFGHPQAKYFGVGRLGKDQVEDYASRKGWTLAQAEQWLAPSLGYEPRN